MKAKIPLIGGLCVLLNFTIQAQEITRSVIASDGGTAATTNIQLDWTLGEAVTETVYTSNQTLTQGFHQSTLTVERKTVKRVGDAFDVVIYPNPVSYLLNIKPSVNSNSIYTAEVVDASGKIISSRTLSTSDGVSQVNVKDLSAGPYFIVIRPNEGASPITFQFIKN